MSRVTSEAVDRTVEALSSVREAFDEAEDDATKNYAKALHEIRKYNRTVRQTSEHLLLQIEDGSDKRLGDARRELRNINVASDLMSRQFDIIQILAQDDLIDRTPDRRASLVGFVNKIIHVLREAYQGRSIRFGSEPRDYDPVIWVSDFTFPILVSVLADNALKYSLDDSCVEVRIVRIDDHKCRLDVVNITGVETQLDERIFNRGYRGSVIADGSGNGLYVAQMVAQQHKTKIVFDTECMGRYNRQVMSVEFGII